VQIGPSTVPSPKSTPFDDLTLDWLRAKPGVKWRRHAASDVLPAWVADMDFPTPDPVRRALYELIDSADLGYPGWSTGSPLRAVFAERMRQRFDWAAEPTRVRETNEVVQGAQLAILHATNPGDTIALHTPTYPPFLSSIAAMDRRILPIPMLDQPDGWDANLPHLERSLRETPCRALVLVNPHNPTGRVFTPDELATLATLAIRHDLLVIADEIHADLTYPPHRHIPLATLPGMAERTVTLNSASKAFNLAGTRCAVAHIGPERLLQAWDNQPGNLYGRANILGVAATLAAWRDGDDWLNAAVTHLDAQRHRLAHGLKTRIPAARHHLGQATYLAWIDFRDTGLGGDPAEDLLASAQVALTSGSTFGPGGEGFARLNFATSADILDEIIHRITQAVTATPKRQRG
jgi:cystathionine beta-lyase